MDLVTKPQVPLPQDMELAEDMIAQRHMPLPKDMGMEKVERPESPQSIWGHRLRQNVRSALLRRGVDMELIEDLESPLQGPQLPKDVQLPEKDDTGLDDHFDGSLPWAQDVHVWPKMFLEDIPSYKPGICKLCTRKMTNITKHHVHPKVDGARRPPLGMVSCSRKYLNTKIDLCRPCHSMIHHIIPNTLMSDSYYSLALLEAHPRVQAWVAWVRRQRIPSPRLQGQPTPAQVLRPVKKRRGVHLLLEKADKNNGNQERLSLTGDLKAKIEGALAKLWSDSGDDFPTTLHDEAALQQKLSDLAGVSLIRLKNIRKVMVLNPKYQGWYKWAFLRPVPSKATAKNKRLARLAARRDEDAAMTFKIQDALAKIWRDAGNDFPRYSGNEASRGKALRDLVSECTGYSISRNRTLQKIMQLDPKYRKWLEWTYPYRQWVARGSQVTRSGRVYNRDLADDIDEEDDDDDSDSDDEMGGANSSVSRSSRAQWKAPEVAGGEDDGRIAVRDAGKGTGSRADPIVFDITDDEGEAVGPGQRGNVEVSPSGRVTIDLTMDDDEPAAADPVHQVQRGGNVQSGFFFDLGGGQTRAGGCFNT